MSKQPLLTPEIPPEEQRSLFTSVCSFAQEWNKERGPDRGKQDPVAKGIIRELSSHRQDVKRATNELVGLLSKEPAISTKPSKHSKFPRIVRKQIKLYGCHFHEVLRSLRMLGSLGSPDPQRKTGYVLATGTKGKLMETPDARPQIESFGILLDELGRFVDQLYVFVSEVQKAGPAYFPGLDLAQHEKLGKIKELLDPLRDRKSTTYLEVPPNTSWESVFIRFISEIVVEIRANKRAFGAKNFAELGFCDARKSSQYPDTLWTLLRLFAVNQGELAGETLQSKPFFKKKVSDLGKKLRYVFDIDDSPFFPYRKSMSYRAKFIISAADQMGSEPHSSEFEDVLLEEQTALERKLGSKYDRAIAKDIRSNRCSNSTD